MFQIGCCINMNATDHDPAGSWSVKHLRHLGFDYIEAPVAQLMAMAPEDAQDFCRLVEASCLPVLAMNNFFSADVKLTGLQADYKRIDTYLSRAFRMISSLGADTVVLGSSVSKNVPHGYSQEEAAAQLIEHVKLVAEHAEKNRVMVVIEPLNRQESNLIIDSREGWDLVRSVNSSHVKLLIDYYHFMMENETLDLLDDYKADICHVHIAEPDGRVYLHPGHKSEYMTFIEKLKSIGYNKKISLEAYTKSFIEDAPVAVDMLRSMLC